MTHDPKDAPDEYPDGEREADESALAELLPQYFALCRKDLEHLKDACELRRFGEIRVLGHNLKGSGGAYGFPELSRLGAEIEAAAKAGNEADVRSGIAQFAAFLSDRSSAS
jgi:HPt (histidine-containing phosphotransfer) domain-containing protein